jgi:hypothetical protein
MARNPYYLAFIDEAGDTGLKAVRPLDPAGATEWFCLGALVIRANYEADLSHWVRAIMAKADARSKRELHYRKLSMDGKRAAVNELAHLPLRAFVVLSNKKNLRGYRNERAERVNSQQWLYNYCIRLLLERVTDFCHLHARGEQARDRMIKVIYSERKAHSYSQTNAYHELLRMQTKGGGLILTKRRIIWEMLDWHLSEAIPHDECFGAQLADIVTSAFYQAIDTLPPTKWNNEFAKLLKPIMAKEKGTHMGYSVALQPTPSSKAHLNDKQKEIFEFYGYKFWP